MSPQYRFQPASFFDAVNSFLRLPSQSATCRATKPSISYPLCINTHIRDKVAFHKASILSGIQASASALLSAKARKFSELHTLLYLPKYQVPCFHGFAHSSFALLLRGENQLLCFHAGAHSFVNMWGWRAPELRYPPRRARNQYLQPARSMFCLPSPQFSGTLPRPSPPRGGRKRDPGGTR
jgi:hypothetical protein